MREEVKDFKRKDLFNYYHKRMNPFVIVTTKIDITNVYNFCKEHKNTYATISYVLTRAINDVEAFKYRYEDEKIYKYDIINPGFTQRFKDGDVGFFNINYTKDYDQFIKEYNLTEQEFLNSRTSISKCQGTEVWLSCLPWFKFTSLIPPFDKNITIPQLIWDKFESEADKYYINLMIMTHHGFTDGYHIATLVDKINYHIKNFPN